MNENCTVYKTLDIIGKKWNLLIILTIYKGSKEKRYSEIKKSLMNITPKILSSRLKELEGDGILSKRIDSSSVPVKTFYSLTPAGKNLITVIDSVKKWGLEWKIKNKDCKDKICEKCEF